MLASPGQRYKAGMPWAFCWRFRAYDPITKRWYTARYAPDLETIQRNHAQYRITGLDRIFWKNPDRRYESFNPYRDPPPPKVKPAKVKPRWPVVGTAT